MKPLVITNLLNNIYLSFENMPTKQIDVITKTIEAFLASIILGSYITLPCRPLYVYVGFELLIYSLHKGSFQIKVS